MDEEPIMKQIYKELYFFSRFFFLSECGRRTFVGQTACVSTSGLSTSLHTKLNINHLPKGNYFIWAWMKAFDKFLCNSERSKSDFI